MCTVRVHNAHTALTRHAQVARRRGQVVRRRAQVASRRAQVERMLRVRWSRHAQAACPHVTTPNPGRDIKRPQGSQKQVATSKPGRPQNRVATPFQPHLNKPGRNLKTGSRHRFQQAKSRPQNKVTTSKRGHDTNGQSSTLSMLGHQKRVVT